MSEQENGDVKLDAEEQEQELVADGQAETEQTEVNEDVEKVEAEPEPEKDVNKVEQKNEEVTKEENEEEKKKDGEEDDEEDEDEESSDEELPLGSVEAPVQIMEGKRERKKAERFVVMDTPKTPERKWEIPVGKGTKLAEIPIVLHYLDKFRVEDVKHMHKFLFGRFPKTLNETKKNIRQFSGFDFEKDNPEYEKREMLLGRFTVEGIKEVLTILDLEKKGKKEDMMDRIMEYCLNPQPSGRKPPEKGQKKLKTQKKSKPKKKKEGSAKKKPKAGGDASSMSEDGNTTMEDGTGGDTSKTDTDSSPTKKKKKSTPKPKSKATPKKDGSKSPKKKKKTPSKEGKEKKEKKEKKSKSKSPSKSEKKASKKRKQSDIADGNSSDDEPLVKKTKSPPTDAQIRKTVENILEGANLEEVTMKMVCRKVYDTYPDFELNHKKDFIKQTVRDIIS